jgi:predicted ATPase
VAALIAEGLTNRDIAHRLFISERTVEGHVEHILNKLGFQRRSQIAVWTREDDRFQHPGNLPHRLTTFVGRRHELDDLRGLVAGARLVSIVGPGGIGKTRLGLELASGAGRRDGAWFVDLAPLTSGERIWDTAAAALGVRESPPEPMRETVLRHLSGRDSLVLLDNCEHVIAAAVEVADALLHRCRNVSVVATSREPLGVYGETVWRAPSLRQDEAVQLFVERARLTSRQATPRPGAQVADLVSRLDRLPLAIELAAARVPVLTPSEILERLDDAFALLTGGARTTVLRHQTLRATVDWSYALLEPAQRRLFDRLSVFAGGFDLDAAEAVAGGPVLNLLADLVDRSLVVADPRGTTTRYRVLEVLRQYGHSQLVRSGEVADVRRRHAEHFLAVGSQMDRQLRLGDRIRWLPRLRMEQGNFRLALEWASGHPGDFGLRLATHLARFWTQDGWTQEGSVWIERMLERETDDPSLLATALHRAGELAYLGGDYETAWSRLERSLAIKRELRDGPGTARRLNLLSIVAAARGDFASARDLANQALALARASDDPRVVGWAELSLGYAAFLLEDREEARAGFERAMERHRGFDEFLGVVYDLSGLIWLDLDRGDVDAARAKIREGVALLERTESTRGERGWLLGGMVLAEAEGRSLAALRLAGAIDATERRGLQMMGAVRTRYQPAVDRARERVGDAQAARLMAEGASMSVEELIQEILGEDLAADAAQRHSGV